MFSRVEKQFIAGELEKALLKLDHPEMPKEEPHFQLRVSGKESWSWADIQPNWVYGRTLPETTDWNENAREIVK